MAWVTVAGLAMGAGGTFLKGKSGDIVRNRLNSIADTPGLDIEALSSQALTNQQRLLPGAQGLIRDEATERQSLVNQLLEQSLPGFGGLRDKVQTTADELLSGGIPTDVSEAVQRNSAARALGGGFSGSGMHRNLQARDLGLTSIGLKSQGLQWLQALRGLSPMVEAQSAFNFTGPNANDLLNIRGQERAQAMNLRARAAGIPGQTAAWGDFLSSTGGRLTGMGLNMGTTGGTSTPGAGVQAGTDSLWDRIGQPGWITNPWYLGKQPGPG